MHCESTELSSTLVAVDTAPVATTAEASTIAATAPALGTTKQISVTVTSGWSK